MGKYHKYVFDAEKREFVGDFENMYKQEAVEQFDSWHQSDSRQLNRKIALAMLEDYCFGRVLDLGCGKGALTHMLKKKNNYVKGVDISPTAIACAVEAFENIDFCCGDISKEDDFKKIMNNKKYDLVFISELLSYLEDYQGLIKKLSHYCGYLLVSLYIPDNPIGFVKSKDDLIEVIERDFEILDSAILTVSRFIVVFAKSKNGGSKRDE